MNTINRKGISDTHRMLEELDAQIDALNSGIVGSELLLTLGCLLDTVKKLKNRLEKLHTKWSKELPFGHGDALDVQWDKWLNRFSIRRMCGIQNRLMIIDEVKNSAFSYRLTEIIADIREISYLIERIEFFYRVPPLDLAAQLFDRLEKVYYRWHLHIFEKMNVMPTAANRTYYDMMLKDSMIKSKFCQIIFSYNGRSPKYLIDIKKQWEIYEDAENIINKAMIGSQISRHRQQLRLMDLEPLFDYYEAIRQFDELLLQQTPEGKKCKEKRFIRNAYLGRRIPNGELQKSLKAYLTEIKYQYSWFAVWCVFKWLNLFENECKPGNFALLMKSWFPESNIHIAKLSNNISKLYSSKYLRNNHFSKWDYSEYIHCEENVGKKPHLTEEKFEALKKLCNKLEKALEKFSCAA